MCGFYLYSVFNLYVICRFGSCPPPETRPHWGCGHVMGMAHVASVSRLVKPFNGLVENIHTHSHDVFLRLCAFPGQGSFESFHIVADYYWLFQRYIIRIAHPCPQQKYFQTNQPQIYQRSNDSKANRSFQIFEHYIYFSDPSYSVLAKNS